MVSLSYKWKLNPESKVEIYDFSMKSSIDVMNKVIGESGAEFTDENFHWVKEKVLKKEEFLAEKKARESLLRTIRLYAKTCESFTKAFKENYFFLLDETFKKIKNELNIAVNKIFVSQLNGEKLNKRKGESMEHYLMRGFILERLHEKYGVREFHEEYSKLKEVLRGFLEGKVSEKEWEKIAKRADLYVILNDGTKLWIEVERTTNTSEINKKLKRLETILSYFPEMIDKVVFVFPSLLWPMAEATLVEARKIKFPADKLEFHEVNLREAAFRHLIVPNPKLVKTEFGDRVIDMIADGYLTPRGKTAMIYKDRIHKKIVIPLITNKLEQKWVKDRKDKIKRLIHFWRIHTRRWCVTEKEIKFKKKALNKIKQNYPFLL